MTEINTVQRGPSGCGIQFVDIKLKVLMQCKLPILKRNSYFKVNKRLSSARWATLYSTVEIVNTIVTENFAIFSGFLFAGDQKHRREGGLDDGARHRHVDGRRRAVAGWA